MKIRLLLITAVLIACCAGLVAQTSQISGMVTDSSGAAVPNARVSVLNKDKGIERKTETNNEGLFVLPSLPAAKYQVTVQAKGFQPITRDGVVLNVNQPVRLDFTLKVGGGKETVTVQASPLINVDSGKVATTVNSTFVDSMPLNGRTFQALLALTPGVVPSYTDSKAFNVNGQRSVSNAFNIDGVSANIATAITSGYAAIQSNGTMMATNPSGTTQAIATMDELQEFTVSTTGYGAEQGRQSGAQVSFATRSGTNAFHGSLYEYFRNDALDAHDWFDSYEVKVGDPFPRRKGKLRQNDIGGSLGGPIWKNHTFFFLAYELDPLRTPNKGSYNAPTQYYRDKASPALLPFIKMFPMSTRGLTPESKTGGYVVSNNVTTSTNASTIKLDQNFGSKLTMFARWHRSPSHQDTPGPGSTYDYYSNTQTTTIGTTYVVSPKLVSDTRFNWSRQSSGQVRLQNNFDGGIPIDPSLLLPPGRDWNNSLLYVSLQDAGYMGASIGGALYKNVQNQLQLTEDLSWTRGKHQFRFGGDARQLTPQYMPNAYGFYLTIKDAEANSVSAYSTYNATATAYIASLSFYATDNWKVSPRLTLDMGVRWEIQPPPTTIKGPKPWVANKFDANNPQNVSMGTPGTPLWATRYGNFAPRFGAAYQLFNRPGRETVLRGSWGLYYDMGLGNFSSFMNSKPYTLTSTALPAPNSKPPVLTPSTYPEVLYSTLPGFGPNPPSPDLSARLGAVTLYDPKILLPYTMSWSFGIEQGLGANQSLNMTYVGNRGSRLLMHVSRYSATNEAAANISLKTNQGSSNYNALQMQFQRRLSKGLQALVNYTWSHALDTESVEINPINSSMVSSESQLPISSRYGPADFDIRHNVSGGVTYYVPAPFENRILKSVVKGWSLAPLMRLYTSAPINIYYAWGGGSLNESQSFYLAPDRVPGEPVWIKDPSAPGGKRLNYSQTQVKDTVVGSPTYGKNIATIQSGAFRVPIFVDSDGKIVSNIRQGDMGRNSVRGFGAFQTDMSIQRRFQVREKVGVEFGAAIFNIFNHPNFNNPQGSIATERQADKGVLSMGAGFSGFTGKSTGLLSSNPGATIGVGMLPIFAFGGQRDIQLSLKITF